ASPASPHACQHPTKNLTILQHNGHGRPAGRAARGPPLPEIWARLQVPTLIVWGTGDIFFRRKWAYWLRDTIPGATEVVELAGARIFFPDERATELTAALRRHWDAHP
ncbi:MAG: alpha/beta fold hydrolase, partial [Streptosporangiaceae bacterium]